MADLLGDDRPPSRRLPVLAVAVLLLLGGYAVIRHASAPQAAPADASPTATATPTPPATRHSAIPSPYLSAYPASAAPTPVSRPWAGLPVRAGPHVDFAAGDRVRSRPAATTASTRVTGCSRWTAQPWDRSSCAVPRHHAARAAQAGRQPVRARHVPVRRPAPAGRRGGPGRPTRRVRPHVGRLGRPVRTRGARPGHRRGRRNATDQAAVRGAGLDCGRSGARSRRRPGRSAVFLAAGSRRPCPRHATAARGRSAAACVRAAPVRVGHRRRGLRRDRDPARRPGQPAPLPSIRQPRGVVTVDGQRRGTQRCAGGVAVLDVRTGRTTRLGVPRRVFVRQVVWERGAVLLAVTTLDGDRGAVLRCQVGHGCRQVRPRASRQPGRPRARQLSPPAQRGSIPHCSRVSQSCSTRSSSASSSRDTHRASAASSPGTGLVGPATMHA